MAEAGAKRLEAEVNELLRRALARFNQRDAERIQEYLSAIGEALGEGVELEQFLLGGSVAKHTYVDGLSDIDALVILDRDDVAGKSPRSVLNLFRRLLLAGLKRGDVSSVETGTLAVTVTYRDGTEIQLLPAVRRGGGVAIANANGLGWNETKPREFHRALTAANDRLNGCLVPVVKLAKSVVAGFPPQKRLTGYHAEALCLDAVKGYRGPKTPAALLVHVLKHASRRVLQPIQDVTRQSRTVDDYLGARRSASRRVVADALAGTARRLEAASTVDQWREVLGL